MVGYRRVTRLCATSRRWRSLWAIRQQGRTRNAVSVLVLVYWNGVATQWAGVSHRRECRGRVEKDPYAATAAAKAKGASAGKAPVYSDTVLHSMSERGAESGERRADVLGTAERQAGDAALNGGRRPGGVGTGEC